MSINNNNSTNSILEKVTLSRSLGLFTITMIGVGGMIGAGIFVLTGIAAGVAGPALVLAFLLNGIVTTFTAMAYAELGSAFPEAGGGYVWVKAGLGGAHGFLAGWMDWCAHVVAGSLYALAFGRFTAELWTMANLPVFNLSVHQMTMIFTAAIIAIFIFINAKGASETGTVGNIITITKIAILFLFTFFGILVMLRTDAWHTRFTTGFMPNGISGVLVAMGLTFVAFEGYEIISQSGEEVVNPMKNIPRAIFIAVAIAVTIYILVSVSAIGSIVPPAGMQAYQYLGQQKEVAIVEVAQQVFPYGIGAIVLLFSGMVSTMSALNATTYSSSRVSFAMGRDHNLPSIFASVHHRYYTPYWAVIFSGCFMLLITWVLPIESVAAAADILFLTLFMQVNIAVILIRHRMPELKRGFKIPWFPAIPLIAILCNLFLTIFLFSFSPVAWFTGIGWIIIGYIVYSAYFSKIEAMEKPKEILMEEVLVSRDYSVLVPVADQEMASILGNIGVILAQAGQGEVLALHVVRVPPQLTLGEGRLFLKEGRANLETVIKKAKSRDVPVHAIIRLGRNVAHAIRKTAEENASDLILLGWPGYTNTEGSSYGSVIDPIVSNPPIDIAVVRYRKYRRLHSVLVPVSGGPNSRQAVKMATTMARLGENGPVKVKLLHVVPTGSPENTYVRAEQAITQSIEGISYDDYEKIILESNDVAAAILTQAETDCDLIVIGATEEPIFKNLLFGNIPDQIAKSAKITVVIVKRRRSQLHTFVRSVIHELFR